MVGVLDLALLSACVLSTTAPVKLIVDTDIGGGGCRDVDDVAAICMANALADRGEAELLAVVVNTQPAPCPGVASVLNHWYGRDGVPIGGYEGVSLGRRNHTKSYVTELVAQFPSPVKNSSQVPGAVAVYRAALAGAADGSVTIASIGLLTNLRALLLSPPDALSRRGGRELFAAKVRLLVVMGGKYPQSNGTGFAECNFAGGLGREHEDRGAGAAASGYVVSQLPPQTRVVFVGFGVGRSVKTGGVLTRCAPAGNPCRAAFINDEGRGGTRSSWDPLATLIAVRGIATAGACAACAGCDGRNSVCPETGHNWWIAGPRTNQTYVVLRNATAAAEAIDELLCAPPTLHPLDLLEQQHQPLFSRGAAEKHPLP